MLILFITTEERRRAQDRAAELDISKSNPPGQHPYVWDNRLNSVIRWYHYGSRENKIGIISFELVQPRGTANEEDAGLVRCTTELFHRPLGHAQEPRQARISEPREHRRLFAFFCEELLGDSDSATARFV